jgi:hypothetical protein
MSHSIVERPLADFPAEFVVRRYKPLRFRFNGSLSPDEVRLLAQGFADAGTDYQELLRAEAIAEAAAATGTQE